MTDNHKLHNALKGHDTQVKNSAFSADDRLLASVSEKEYGVWEVRTGSCCYSLPNNCTIVMAPIMSSDGLLLGCPLDACSYGFWGAETRLPYGSLNIVLECHGMAFPPNCHLFAWSMRKLLNVVEINKVSSRAMTLDH
jgi:WD40 repeat protein